MMFVAVACGGGGKETLTLSNQTSGTEVPTEAESTSPTTTGLAGTPAPGTGSPQGSDAATAEGTAASGGGRTIPGGKDRAADRAVAERNRQAGGEEDTEREGTPGVEGETARSNSPLRRHDVSPPGAAAQFRFYGGPRETIGPTITTLTPSEGSTGTTFQFSVVATGEGDVVLDLYRVTGGEFVYIADLGPVDPWPEPAVFVLATVSGDPTGTYCVGSRPPGNCAIFTVN